MVGTAPIILTMDTPVDAPYLTPKKNAMTFWLFGIWGMIGLTMIGTPVGNVAVLTKTLQTRSLAVIVAKLQSITTLQIISKKVKKRVDKCSTLCYNKYIK